MQHHFNTQPQNNFISTLSVPHSIVKLSNNQINAFKQTCGFKGSLKILQDSLKARCSLNPDVSLLSK